jgi:hypothetical protein
MRCIKETSDIIHHAFDYLEKKKIVFAQTDTNNK